MENMARTFYILYFISFTTLLFGGLGLFGAFKGQQWALIMVGRRGPEDPADHKVPVLTPPQRSDASLLPCGLLQSAVGMIIISLFMTACEIPALTLLPQVSQEQQVQDLRPIRGR